MTKPEWKQELKDIKTDILFDPTQFHPEVAIQIRAPLGKASHIAALLAKTLKECGCNVQIVDSGPDDNPATESMISNAYKAARECPLPVLISAQKSLNDARSKDVPGYATGVAISVEHLPWN